MGFGGTGYRLIGPKAPFLSEGRQQEPAAGRGSVGVRARILVPGLVPLDRWWWRIGDIRGSPTVSAEVAGKDV